MKKVNDKELAAVIALTAPDRYGYFLRQVADRHTFWVIYCFMPDHAHLIFMGRAGDSDILQGVEDFKQSSGYWLESNYFLTSWQKSFHDRIIRARELGLGVRYALDNPVREGLVSHWREYPFLGAIGLDLETFLEELGPD